ncbi:MAG: translation initiation factor [Planctomycetaceae bacterium]|nr:translation initiation factor [Planctomycetaceae bacterium]
MQKIRIFALAKELSMDSKDLIEACAKVGIILKNSALASISPEEKDKVLEFLKGSSPVAQAPSKAVPVVPVRETPKHVDKPLVNIMAAKAQGPRLVPRQQRTAGGQSDDVTTGAVATIEAPADKRRAESAAETISKTTVEETVTTTATTTAAAVTSAVSESTSSSVDTAAAAATPAASSPEVPVIIESTPAPAVELTPEVAAPSVVEVEPQVEVSAPEVEQTAVQTGLESSEPDVGGETIPATPVAVAPVSGAGTVAPSVARSAAPKAPLRRDDYIAPGGVRRQPFNMVPQGTVDMSKAANKAVDAKKVPKSRPGPNLPNFAAMPEYKPVVAPQPVAQKPDMKLPTGATINDVKPLEQMLRKSKTAADAKKKGDGDDKAVVKKRGVLTLEEEIEAAGKAKAKLGVKRGAGLEDSRKARQTKRGGDLDDEDEGGYGKRKLIRPKHKSFVAPAKTSSEIELPITIRSLSECIGRPAKDLLKILFMRNAAGAVNINSVIDEDVAVELALECGVDLSIRRERDLEQELFQEDEESASTEGYVARPPIITILGHVDHGKTTLLDTIRGAKVAAGEAGGITQHIAAYQVEKSGHKLTFVDTPGHAAFTAMRARGAGVTDIIVLVVAADDGVMPQTAEAISHAKAAGVPIIVALNKCDLPGRNEQKVLQDLARHEIMPAEWGGDVEVVRTSGLTGLGIDNLLETLLLTAELHEYKSNPNAPAGGVCLEAFRDEGRGTVAWLMVQRGTLKIGDTVVCGEAVGRIRNIYNDRGEDIREAGPSTPVKVSGLDVVPYPGDKFVVTEDGEAARQLADDRRSSERAKSLAAKVRPMTLEDVLDKVKGGGVRDLPLIIKADSPGSLEALRHELGKFDHPEVRVTVVHEGVGGVNESDVYLAAATKSVIVAFHVIPEDRAEILAEQEGVEIRQYQIIYEVTDHIKLALEGLLKPSLQQVSTGRALVLRTFFISRVGGTIAGCRVLNGTIERSNRVRVIRDHRILNDYAIGSLKREKDDVKEVREGFECGIRLENFNDVKEGDLFEAYRIEEVKRKLE